jgi:enoyl-CoA hydratase
MGAQAFETIRYEVDGPVATITLARPDAANAQNSQLIYDLDAAFDRADADDAVRVVVLAADGKHFSAGHDLKELLAGTEHWSAMRDTPEGKLVHEQTMYFDKLVRIRDFRKVTIAAVQGTCSAAGLMLACMCDLIVAADDARFSNPVLRMSGVGVELLIEPWELGPRKAKEFLFCSETFSADEAERYGLVNRVVPRAELGAAAREMADKVALVPALTAEMVKASINHMVDGMGQRESWRYHFMLHQFVSNTPTALAKVEARKQGGMDAVKREQGQTARRPQAEPARRPQAEPARRPQAEH